MSSSPISYEAAHRSKEGLARQLAGQAWFAGIAVVSVEEGYAVRVTIDRSAARDGIIELPAQFESVNVQRLEQPNYELRQR